MDLIHNIHIQNITKILKGVGERIEGNLICDIRPDNWIIHNSKDKIYNLQQLVKDKKKVIEIGVNGCHSLVIMLLINPHAEYLLFDLGNHRYTRPAVDYIKDAFPNTKIDIIYGNSVNTMNEYILQNSKSINTYELIHLDGGHTPDIFIHDYNNSKKLLAPDGVVIFDDYNYSEIKNFIDHKVATNEIVKYSDGILLDTPLHFIYKYN